MNIRFVYFDVGGVLLHWWQMVEELASLHGKTQEEVASVYLKYDAAGCRGEITTQELAHAVHKDLGVNMPEGFDFQEFTLNSFYPIKETHELVHEVSKKFSVGLLTNVYGNIYEPAKKRGHIPDIAYHTVVKSCEIGLIKPEKEIYLHAQEKAGVPAHEILFIDDMKENIEGAKAMGWQGVVFETHKPHLSIKKIRKLLRLK